ncbi:DUF2256 domain-containing protein [Lewinella cohaerens]|uniref:DUF2256 domain-containing protein n=1 Tax=Lewinella cohaerens TaxID=70995 RepID=UPI0008FC1711|nr:DUF2256 domain-containing protein [Lewinella cohaerens]
MPKTRKKADFPQKLCLHCQRPFYWRKKWEKVWDEVKYCSNRCGKENRQDRKNERKQTAS